MPMTTSDILANADAFRRAHPDWPHADSPEARTGPKAAFRARNQWLRQSLAGRIKVVLVPGDDPETDRLYAEEKADHD